MLGKNMTISRRVLLGASLFFLGSWKAYGHTTNRGERYRINTPGLSSIPRKYRKRKVRYDTGYDAGTVVVDTGKRFLYLQLENGRAYRYGVGVGRAGFSWKGTARIGRKAKWPGWTPPAAMRRRQPYLPRHMPGGVNNPLGARALYLYRGNRDTLYRIHGTNEPQSIGKALSSGCVRMINEDVADLYERVQVGAKVVVL